MTIAAALRPRPRSRAPAAGNAGFAPFQRASPAATIRCAHAVVAGGAAGWIVAMTLPRSVMEIVAPAWTRLSQALSPD